MFKLEIAGCVGSDSNARRFKGIMNVMHRNSNLLLRFVFRKLCHHLIRRETNSSGRAAFESAFKLKAAFRNEFPLCDANENDKSRNRSPNGAR